MCYNPILEELKKYFPVKCDSENKLNLTANKEIKILIPGAGLGRLLYEVAKLGYSAQGNEFSYFMLLCSNFMLNCASQKDEFSIYPLIHTYSNVFWEQSPVKEFKIPDVDSNEDFKHTECNMSMVAGEFVEIYKEKLSK